MIYNDSFRVRISTAYGLAITLIRACAKTEKGSIYFMDTNESALFAETLERILHQTDCAALDNFCDTSLDFNYCISHEDECIEIVIKGRYSYSKHSYHLSHAECQSLILEIYKKLDELKTCQIGECLCCGRPIYKDNTHYVQVDGTLVHGICMEDFISGKRTHEIKLPVAVIQPIDCFGFIERYKEQYQNKLFPKRRIEG